MNTVILTMPRLGETMEEGKVSHWLVECGKPFMRGHALIEFETDKTAVEYPALGSGMLVNVFVKPGDVVKLGEPLAEIDLQGAQDWVTLSQSSQPQSSKPQSSKPQSSKQENNINDTRGNNANNAVTHLENSVEEFIEIDLLMPRLGETMEEGKITTWLVDVGTHFQRGDSIIEVETDKTIAEFPALENGLLIETCVTSGEVVQVGTKIATILVKKNSENLETSETHNHTKPEEKQIRAAPLARQYAKKHNLSLEDIKGTGRKGRIELSDVESYLQNPSEKNISTTIYYGPAHGKNILMVHGFAGDKTTFDTLAKALARHGFHVKLIDLPGHGENPTKAQNFDDLVEALSFELDKNAPVHIIAHSLGCAVSVAATLKHKDAVLSLSLLAPAGLGLAIDEQFILGMAQATSAGTIAHLLERLSEKSRNFSHETMEKIYQSLAKGNLVDLANSLCRNGYQTINIRQDLATLSQIIPTKIIFGCQDKILNWQDSLDVSPNISLHIFAKAGHMPHWDEAETVENILIQAFKT